MKSEARKLQRMLSRDFPLISTTKGWIRMQTSYKGHLWGCITHNLVFNIGLLLFFLIIMTKYSHVKIPDEVASCFYFLWPQSLGLYPVSYGTHTPIAELHPSQINISVPQRLFDGVLFSLTAHKMTRKGKTNLFLLS